MKKDYKLYDHIAYSPKLAIFGMSNCLFCDFICDTNTFSIKDFREIFKN